MNVLHRLSAWGCRRLCTLLGVGCLTAAPLSAQGGDSLRTDDPTRYVQRATLYGVGSAHVLDTYLSPQAYKGMDFRLSRESVRMTRIGGGGKVWQQLFFQTDLGYTHNRVDNNNTLSLLANWNYGLHRRFPLTHNFRLTVGGVADLNGGFVYNMRNGNNPAQARAYANLDASGGFLWDLRLARRPLNLRYQLNVPLLGVMFMPEYGQSYYEIFSLGHAGGVVNFTSLHNQPALRQIISADYPVGKLKMRLAYIWDAQQAKVNGIKTHTYSHVFMVGFVKEFYLLK